MPSPQDLRKTFANHTIQAFDHDPNATTAIVTSPDGGTTKRAVDLRDFECFAVIVKPTIVAAGGLTKVEIVANTASDFTGTTVVIKDSGTVAADALDDYVVQECSAAEVKQEGNDQVPAVDLRYVAARMTMATATDEASVVYIRSKPRYPQNALTATNIT